MSYSNRTFIAGALAMSLVFVFGMMLDLKIDYWAVITGFAGILVGIVIKQLLSPGWGYEE